jgi:hypothetical protein
MHRSRTLGAVLMALVTTAPVTSNAVSQFASVLHPVEIRERALEHGETLNTERRAYTKVLELCQEYLMAGEDIVCPAINDLLGIRALLRGELRYATSSVSSSSAGSVSSQAPRLSIDQVTGSDLSLLRRFQKLQMCPPGLKEGKQPGYYELCLEMIQDASQPKTQRSRAIERQVRARLQRAASAQASSKNDVLNDRLQNLPAGIRPDR